MNDSGTANLLDALTPSYDDRTGDWQRVVADAHAGSLSRDRGWSVRAAVALAAVAAVAFLVLAWPFAQDQPGLLERARAAIGDGQVLHVVLRGEWGGTLVNLTTSERTPVYGENEVWFDTESGQTHTIERTEETRG
jgi:hypothetical protein